MKNVKRYGETEEQRFHSDMGARAYDAGVTFDKNPFGIGDMRLRSFWAAGWVDRQRGMI